MDAEHDFKRRDWDPRLLRKVQAICLRLPEAVEAEQFGGPWWKARDKAFALYGAESEKRADGHHGVDGLTVNLTLDDQAALLEDPRFRRPHYIGKHGWVTLRFDGEPDWAEVEELVVSAYRKVANRRQLRALDTGA